MIRPRLAMLDLDGTLLHLGQFRPGALEFIERLDAAGVAVALCSGRSLESMHLTASGLPPVRYVAAGGGSIVQERGDDGWRTLGERFLSRHHVRHAVELTAAHGMELWAYTRTEWLVTAPSDRADFERRFTGVEPRLAPLEGRDDVAKLLTFVDAPGHEAVLEALDRLEGVSVVSSFAGTPDDAPLTVALDADDEGRVVTAAIPAYYDVIPEASAGTKGGDVLIDALGISWAEVVAMGDGSNDLGMLGRAGTALLVPPRHAGELDAPASWQRRHACADPVEAIAILGV